jgi:hypothetical protein
MHATSATFFAGNKPLSALVGNTFRSGDATVVPLPHPSGVSRWLNQPDNPSSNWTDTQIGAIGEYFNYEVRSGPIWREPILVDGDEELPEADPDSGIPAIIDGGAGPPGDYLYGSQPLDWQWLGMWGIFRVPGAQVPDLQPLPDRGPPQGDREWPALSPEDGTARPADRIYNTCPPGTPLRRYHVVAIQEEITYNATTGDPELGALIEEIYSPAPPAQVITL